MYASSEEEKNLKYQDVNSTYPCDLQCTYGSFEMSGPDVEADRDVKTHGWGLVFFAQRHLLVNLLRQNQRRHHLNYRTGPTTQRTLSEFQKVIHNICIRLWETIIPVWGTVYIFFPNQLNNKVVTRMGTFFLVPVRI